MSELKIPPHVLPELVHSDYPFAMGLSTTRHPFDELVRELQQGPDIKYFTDAYPINLPAWIPRRLEHIKAIYLDEEHFSAEGLSPFPLLVGGSWKVTPIEIDPPGHADYRRFLNPMFTPQRLKLLDEKVRQTARHFVSQFKDSGECEFMEDFSKKFPIAVFLDLMGLPQARMQQFMEWENSLFHSLDFDGIAEATRQVVAYLREVIEQRKQQPREDIISLAVAYEIAGRKLDDDELLGLCFNLFIGGLDTVTTNISWQIRHLAEHQDHQRRLRESPDLIPNAVESLYRRYASVTTFRTCVKEINIGGATMMPGDKVAMTTTLANNDPDAWQPPFEVDIEQPARHLAFGYGVHRCVGAALARRESVVAIEELFDAIPQFRIKDGAILTSELGPILQPKNLPLTW
jgi:cytochrome P450